nr:hypothetical protein [Tanacetum cinerariifolium]
MAGRSTRSNTANNTNPPNEKADEVTRQLNTALPNLLTRLVQALGVYQANQRDVAQSYSIKTFRASGAKEFFGTQKLESKFWNHKMVGSDIDGYTARFHELARLMPYMVTPESQRVNRYIWSLAPEIKAHVTSSKPATIQGVIKKHIRQNKMMAFAFGSRIDIDASFQGKLTDWFLDLLHTENGYDLMFLTDLKGSFGDLLKR